MLTGLTERYDVTIVFVVKSAFVDRSTDQISTAVPELVPENILTADITYLGT